MAKSQGRGDTGDDGDAPFCALPGCSSRSITDLADPHTLIMPDTIVHSQCNYVLAILLSHDSNFEYKLQSEMKDAEFSRLEADLQPRAWRAGSERRPWHLSLQHLSLQPQPWGSQPFFPTASYQAVSISTVPASLCSNLPSANRLRRRVERWSKCGLPSTADSPIRLTTPASACCP